MATTIQLRRGTAAQWTTANPVLASGEVGLELDTRKYKVGDGVTSWTSLDYSVAIPESHASSHQDGGSDEIATTTPGANAIPKATVSGTLEDGLVSGYDC
jgi:hypothetical protein